ncbi:MAG: HAD family hydrolase [Acidipropionibacterium sp.]|jgi:hydroxymethylpyrimidine pyrophosphatase-like HAD family hydrolase|nr:HAD family hydrolase [Acidipropionibacterium sp.]
MGQTSKSIFIDFDGTFADHGRVPASHLRAVRLARDAGHRVLLCTGRPRVFVSRRFRDEVFDGLVCAAGGYVEVGGQLLDDRRFPAEVAAATASLLTDHDATFFLEAPDRVFTSPASAQRLGGFFSHLLDPGEPEPTVEVREDLRDCSFSKVSIVGSPVPVDRSPSSSGRRSARCPTRSPGRPGPAASCT